jgi:hypothetical protein
MYDSRKICIDIEDANLIIGNDEIKFKTYLNLCNVDVAEDIVEHMPYLIKDKESLKKQKICYIF